jgi:hypothetical protein
MMTFELFSDPDIAFVFWDQAYGPKVQSQPPTTHFPPANNTGPDWVFLVKDRFATRKGRLRRAAKLPPFEFGKVPTVEQILTPKLCLDIRQAISAGNVSSIEPRAMAAYFVKWWQLDGRPENGLRSHRRGKALRRSLTTGEVPKVQKAVAASYFKKAAKGLLAATNRKHSAMPVEDGA